MDCISLFLVMIIMRTSDTDVGDPSIIGKAEYSSQSGAPRQNANGSFWTVTCVVICGIHYTVLDEINNQCHTDRSCDCE